MNLYFFQCQESYGNSIYLPYSSGILWAYSRQFKEIKDNYTLADIFFEKLPIDDYLNKIVDPDVVLFSNYGWNTSYHISIAKELKKLYPNVFIGIGGPNAQQSESYLRTHDYIDVSMWGEGEETVHELLAAIANNSELSEVNGLAYIKNSVYHKTDVRARKNDLSQIPSPYLEGVFDEFFTRYPHYNFMPVWETHRGCPYHCTFCDLGADYYNKVYIFETDRLLKEIDWFSEKHIEYVEVADANFGIFARDLDLVKYIKQKHNDNGFPEKINATWAKNSPERLLEMSKILDSMNRGGVTLALQSQNKTALGNIKRINIANDRLEEIAKKYINLGIPTYHDFILGLPGETLSSWIEGISYVIDINPDGWIFGHPLEAYENTEFSDPHYINTHKLIFANTPQVSFFAHRNKDLPLEIGKYVVSTNTMNQEEYIEAFLFKYFMITMHNLGWVNIISERLSKELNIKKSSIYHMLYDYTKLSDNIVHQEYQITKASLRNTITSGAFWGRQMFGSDDFYWEYESASSCVFASNYEKLYEFISTFVSEKFGDKYIKYIYENQEKILIYDRDINQDQISFKEFCQQTYWKGRRIKKWKK